MDRRILTLSLICGLVSPVACTCDKGGGESPSVEAPSPSVNSKGVTLANTEETCAYREAWKHKIRKKCTTCISLAKAPACGCNTDRKAYSGKCASFENKRLAAKEACEETWQCAYACKPGDCACASKCFQQKPECEKLQLEVDLCVVDVCEEYCDADEKS